MHPIERRLRDALRDTHDELPRPIAELDLPLGAERWIKPSLLKAFRPAAVLAPIIRRDDQYSVLLTLRAAHLKSHKGQISFPGGGREEQDATVADTAKREAMEEVGLPPDRVEVLGYLDDYPIVSNYLVTPVVGLIDGDFEPEPDPSEVDAAFEVPLEFVLDPNSYTRKRLSRDGLIVPYFEFHWEHYRVWGATAGMLRGLCALVESHEQ